MQAKLMKCNIRKIHFCVCFFARY